jgi:hypothetical protein
MLSRPDKSKRRANARPNRGPHKQVFVCGVAERSGPVRQDIIPSNRRRHRAGDSRTACSQPYKQVECFLLAHFFAWR